ncbi:MAG: hypothetical protein ABDH63_06155 [Candidatus Caldarchaeales archaeon]
MDAFHLAGTVALMLFGTFAFVDAVEALGQRLGLTRHATGALLAAALTALPETFIALVASLSGDGVRGEVGLASVLAAPSITLLLGFPVLAASGAAKVSPGQIVPLYAAFAIGASLLPVTIFLDGWAVRIAGLAYVAAYVPVARRIASEEGEPMEGRELAVIERLLGVRSIPVAFAQALAGVLSMTLGADHFISTVSVTVDPFAVTMLLSPLATCMEEVIVAFYWAVEGKGDAAASLLAGENAIQATFVFGAGLLFTGIAPTLRGLSVVPVYVAGAAALIACISTGRVRLSGAIAALYAVYLLVWSGTAF